MVKTTVYLPDDLETRLDAEAAASGVSKAELIRRGIAMVLEASGRPREKQPLPVLRSGQSRDVTQLAEDVSRQIKDRASRR
ncbi:CopG family transcriptional regulator [Saccharomonospora piscinae]|uniref:CopG family transcriptional regulator n=2 Tax=Saccharomonospora piscinae TaxID=687388 RepID=A0A1V9A7V1_SACPI|nr:CopG family transcriptional regulator [Saccharomonospora piscinae]OQO93217.1 CopG family transcriptional regulator [Saccharomonospora piscinae]TLW91521.1 ribbon-helix-helix protein, CopG family [Saccharomonospora piscinae]